jgi:serine/threonine-protein kinase
MAAAQMNLNETLDIAIQIASALAVAHEAGIIHRDIKPENVMLRRRDSIVKVLDFGLAKLTAPESSEVDTEAATQALFKTDPGTVVGTVVYMSPEQARGIPVDGRTDIFSLGVVLYEMTAGRLPFAGSSTNEVISAILSKEQPAPLARFARNVPDRLEEIVTRALTKDREERYQTAKDLLIDLKRLKQKLEIDAEIERSVAPEVFGVPPSGSRVTDAKSSPPEGGTPNAHPTNSAESIITEIKRHKRSVAIALAAIILLSVAGIAYYFYFARGGGRAPIDSIAVLPLVNTSGDPNTEYLSDGISEALINSLTELQQLRVIARSTAFRYKGKEVDPQAVGRDLNVRAVLMGRVRQMGDTLNIQVDLVDATTGAQLWGGEYERKISDVLVVKQDIAREVTEKLRLRLSGEEQKQLIKRDTTNAEAYQLYLKGRYHLNRLTDEGFMKGRDYFQQAIDRDPNYALAYVGLADAYTMLSGFNVLSPKDAYPRAKEAAMKALGLDDKLAEAHTSLGAVKFFYDWDWASAEREFRRAIEINPGYSDAHQMYSYHLSAVGRLDEALAEMRRAQELDPLSIAKIAGMGEIFNHKRQYDQAIEQYQKALEMDPNSGFVHWALGNVYVQKGMYAEAIAEYQKAIPLSGDSPDEPAALGYAYALSGKRHEAQELIDELKERSKRRYISPTVIAFIYAGLGEKDQAFALLDKAYDERDSILVLLKVEPAFNNLRSDPRFAELMRRVGLPP